MKCPGQGCEVTVQIPPPLQALVVVAEPVQVAPPQLVPAGAFRQTPVPVQVPSSPQGGDAGHSWCGSAAPAGTGWQAPAIPATLHAWQVGQLAAEQQTPSTQLPLAHWPGAVQICPSRLRPQDPALQLAGIAQSASLLQADRQPWVAALQTYGAQGWVLAGLQAPAPSQVRASVVVVGSAQAGGAHCVPAG